MLDDIIRYLHVFHNFSEDSNVQLGLKVNTTPSNLTFLRSRNTSSHCAVVKFVENEERGVVESNDLCYSLFCTPNVSQYA